MHLLKRNGAQNNYAKCKQSQGIPMNGVSDMCKHHSEYFVNIFQVTVIRGHEVKRSK